MSNENNPDEDGVLDRLTSKKSLRFVWLASLCSACLIIALPIFIAFDTRGIIDLASLPDVWVQMYKESLYVVMAWMFGVGIISKVNEHRK